MRKKTIRIRWTEKICLEDSLTSEHIDENGIYMITRIWGTKNGNAREEKILYIGKTISSFKSRIRDHSDYWIPELRGEIYVRFGLISSKYDNDLLEDIESALIYHVQPQENTAKKNIYTFRTDYLPCIINEGIENLLDKCIDAKEQVDWDTIE